MTFSAVFLINGLPFCSEVGIDAKGKLRRRNVAQKVLQAFHAFEKPISTLQFPVQQVQLIDKCVTLVVSRTEAQGRLDEDGPYRRGLSTPIYEIGGPFAGL